MSFYSVSRSNISSTLWGISRLRKWPDLHLIPVLLLLSLTDLDNPYLEDFTADEFNALKILWSASGPMVWLTQGSRKANPYSNTMTGLAHTLKKEYPNLNLQTFDLDFKDRAGTNYGDTALELAETLLRKAALHSWGGDADAMLWTAEPQIFK